MPARKKISKAEQKRITTQKLVQIARTEFSKRGYSAVSTEEIVRLAGVTRGALYHHFSGKQDLFLAAFVEAQQEIAARIAAAADAAESPWEQLTEGCRAFLEACIDPQLRQIVAVDAPAVLGWDLWRRIDAQNGLTQLRAGLEALIAAGVIKAQPVDALAHLLSGAMNEAALWIAQSADPSRALQEALDTLEALLQSLRAD